MTQYLDQQSERIKKIFNSKDHLVSKKTLQIYFEYFKENLEFPCVLTGIESMGYFSWEERFDLGFGSKKEYKILRSERGSYKDNYELKNFDGRYELTSFQAKLESKLFY